MGEYTVKYLGTDGNVRYWTTRSTDILQAAVDCEKFAGKGKVLTVSPCSRMEKELRSYVKHLEGQAEILGMVEAGKILADLKKILGV